MQNEQTHTIEFRGSTGEYFRIWFVNLLLTLATLGIYSAWAKVRNRKYLYGSTFLDEANFDYLASPINILAGRVLVVAFIVGGAYWAGESPLRNAAYFVLVLVLLPWALLRSYAFNARYSTYRNIHFRFRATWGVLLRLYLLFAPLSLLLFLWLYWATFPTDVEEFFQQAIDTQGEMLGALLLLLLLVLPFLMRAFHRLKATHMYWGSHQVNFEGMNIAHYFYALFSPLLFAALTVALHFSTDAMIENLNDGLFFFSLFLVPIAVFLTLFSLIRMPIMLFRLYWQGVVLPGGGRMECNFNSWFYAFWIAMLNQIAVSATIGLLYPWAQVRKIRYLSARTVLLMPAGALEEIATKEKQNESALGSEFDAAEGLGFGIDIV